MTTRCKFKLDSIETTKGHISKLDADGNVVHDDGGKRVYENGLIHTLKFSPVYHNDNPNHENSKFWAFSPSGQFVLGTINGKVVADMEIGREYYLDITPAPK